MESGYEESALPAVLLTMVLVFLDVQDSKECLLQRQQTDILPATWLENRYESFPLCSGFHTELPLVLEIRLIEISNSLGLMSYLSTFSFAFSCTLNSCSSINSTAILKNPQTYPHPWLQGEQGLILLHLSWLLSFLSISYENSQVSQGINSCLRYLAILRTWKVIIHAVILAFGTKLDKKCSDSKWMHQLVETATNTQVVFLEGTISFKRPQKPPLAVWDLFGGSQFQWCSFHLFYCVSPKFLHIGVVRIYC